MCLAIPALVLEINDGMALVDLEGSQMHADLSLVENINLGDYVMVHAGIAIQKYDLEEANETLKLIREMAKKVPRE